VQGSSASYHGYWGLDFTTVDPHLGSDADFAAFVDCAHALDLRVYLDVVVNHTADVVLLPGGTTYSDLPYQDCRGRRFVPARYAGGRTFPCLSATTSFPRTPVLLPADRRAKKPAWLNDVRRYHNRGDIDWASCTAQCFEQGDFFGLDDLFTEQPVVARGLADLYASWIRRFHVDGFRVDTARHVDAAFFRVWLPRILAAARQAGVADFQVFGEVFLTDTAELSAFVRYRALPNVLDFPMWDTMVRYASGSSGPRGIVARLADDDYFNLPAGVAHTPPTFLGNHDVGRAARLIADQSNATGDALRERVLLGHSLLYLLRGAPVVYYGDEFGIVGAGGDKQARQDLFPTRVPAWQREERVGSPPIGTGSSFDVTGHPVGEHLRRLGALREAHPALSTGSSAVRLAADGVLAVSRFDTAARREYLAAFNTTGEPLPVVVRTATPSSSWGVLLGAGGPLSSAADGRLRLTVPALGAVLLRADAVLPPRPVGTLAVRVGADDFTLLQRIQVTGVGGDPASVTVAIQRSGASAWRRVGIDASPPYRVFVDPRRFRKGERVSVVAVARSSSGVVTTSPVVTAVVRR
jgi:glycosidase